MNPRAEKTLQSVEFAGFRLDMLAQRLWRGSESISLRPKSWQVLVQLVERPGALVTIDELLSAVWSETTVTPAVLTNVISELRRVFDDRGQPARVIETVHRRGYRFIAAVAPSGSGDDPAPAPDLVPESRLSHFIGRERELEQLEVCRQQAAAGEPQLVLVSGDAGIGKSTLLDQLARRVADTAQPVLLGRAHCREQRSGREGLSPLLDIVEQWAARPEGQAQDLLGRLRRYAPSWLAQISWLLPPDEMQLLRQSLLGSGSDRLVREGAGLLEVLAQTTFVVLLVEDLHWADAATLDLLAALAQRGGRGRLLVVGTYRPVDALVHQHAVVGMARLLRQNRQATEIMLAPFVGIEVQRYLEWRFPELSVDAELTAAMERHSGGNPLFLGALATYLDERGWIDVIDDIGGTSRPSLRFGLELPHDIRAAVEAQLAQLPAAAVAVLEAGSLVGDSFSPTPVAAGLELPLDEVEDRCHELASLGHIVCLDRDTPRRSGRPEARYRFLHSSYRRVLYDRVAPSRRRVLHQRIGESLEQTYAPQLAENTGELLVHFENADDVERRVRYRELAGMNAAARFGHSEAAEHFTEAVAQLQRLPHDRAHRLHEANLQLAIGNAVGLGNGYADPGAAEAFSRAESIAREIEAHRERFRALLGLGGMLSAEGNVFALRRIVDQQLEMVASVSPQFTAQAYWRSGVLHLGRGDFSTARAHLERALAAEGEAGIPVVFDFRNCAEAELASTLAALGCIDQARRVSEQALLRSESVGLPFGRCHVIWLATITSIIQHDYSRTSALVNRLHALAEGFGFASFNAVMSLHGSCALVHQGRGNLPSVTEMEDAIGENRRVAGRHYESMVLMELSRAHLVRGDSGMALEWIERAFAAVETLDEHWLGAEMYRVRAECRIGPPGNRRLPRRRGAPHDDAEENLRRAIALARRQDAKLWELRATTTLVRLLGDGKAAGECLGELATLVDWFSEGRESRDLLDARAVLGR